MMPAVVNLSLLTLNQLFRMRRVIVVTCRSRSCTYSREYSGWHLAKMIQDVGDGEISLRRLAERSICSRCGVRRMIFTIKPKEEPPDPGPTVAAS